MTPKNARTDCEKPSGIESTTVPATNNQISGYLYSIETALGELIIQEVGGAAGPKWFKQRVPETIRKEATARYEAERASRWSTFVPFHQIYYTNFGELKQIIERADNWKLFANIFKGREVLIGTLAGRRNT